MGGGESKLGDLGWRTRFSGLATLAICLLLAVSAPLASATPRLAPSGFRLQASNGYTLTLFAGGNPRTGQGGVSVALDKRAAHVLYLTPATVTATSIEADLGPVGRIDVHFVPSGRTKTERSECGQAASFNAGNYEGTIDFRGEQGYSQVQATSARGEIRVALSLLCARSVGPAGIGGHAPGAQLTARHRGDRSVSFEAIKNGSSRPARFVASISEQRGAVRILREVSAVAAPSAFSFDVPSGFATVAPPAPFAGQATYRRPGSVVSWRGDLAVDFPGRPGVSLTGPGTHAGLVRAVLNPSHPFRIP